MQKKTQEEVMDILENEIGEHSITPGKDVSDQYMKIIVKSDRVARTNITNDDIKNANVWLAYARDHADELGFDEETLKSITLDKDSYDKLSDDTYVLAYAKSIDGTTPTIFVENTIIDGALNSGRGGSTIYDYSTFYYVYTGLKSGTISERTTRRQTLDAARESLRESYNGVKTNYGKGYHYDDNGDPYEIDLKYPKRLEDLLNGSPGSDSILMELVEGAEKAHYKSLWNYMLSDEGEKILRYNEPNSLVKNYPCGKQEKEESSTSSRDPLANLDPSGEDTYPGMSGQTRSGITSILGQELMALEGLHGQNPETGKSFTGSDGQARTYLGEYTNRVFGSPFQLIDSVDKRFDEINPYVGNEYLRNFLLNSPILYIKPGIPKYTGGTDPNSLQESIKNIYVRSTGEDNNIFQNIIEQLLKSTVYGNGAKLQRRLFGFRETYYQYMQNVNYMCRSLAIYIGLTSEPGSTGLPDGIFTGAYSPTSSQDGGESDFKKFVNMEWQNYRMLSSSKCLSPFDYLKELIGAATDQSVTAKTISTFFAGVNLSVNIIGDLFINLANLDTTTKLDDNNREVDMAGLDVKLVEDEQTGETVEEINFQENLAEALTTRKDEGVQTIAEIWSSKNDRTVASIIEDKITSVQFMVEPLSFTETIQNDTKQSVIESGLNMTSEIGAEVAFITNSNVDVGIIGNLLKFLGDAGSNIATNLSGLVTNATGNSYLQSVFSGALGSLKGQRMIYPEIYENTRTGMHYEFKLTLSAPYGDLYGFYTEIGVPLCHLIALAVPRMITANSLASPFLVQAYIPGMCTCQLGIISDMTITKNPDADHVSVNGLPLTVTVTFQVKELYNSMAISPANDPTSFLFNETLNDYLANMAGLQPSGDTYRKQQTAMFDNLANYNIDEEFGFLGPYLNELGVAGSSWIEDLFPAGF